jgi:hypothetical protein
MENQAHRSKQTCLGHFVIGNWNLPFDLAQGGELGLSNHLRFDY